MSMDVDNDTIYIDLSSIKDTSLVHKIEQIVSQNESQRKMLQEYSNQLSCAQAEIQELRNMISENVEVRNSINDDLPHKRQRTDANNSTRPTVVPPQPTSMESTIKKQKKIFQVIETDVKTVKKQLKDIKCDDYTIKQTSVKAPIKISIADHDDVPKIRNAFKNSNISCHEFKLESEKSKCFIIRGLTGVSEVDLPDIKNQLIANGLPFDISVSLFVSGHMRANPSAVANSLIKLVLPPNCDIKVLQKVKAIDHVIVRFEEFKNKSIIQCKNCQRFGHSAGGCMHRHRCVKCGADHYKADCPRSRDKSIKLHCCNCGGEHTANNLTVCKFFKDNYVQAPPARKVLGHAPTMPVNSKVSFSEVAKSAGSRASHNDLTSKIDLIFEMLSSHDKLLQRILRNG